MEATGRAIREVAPRVTELANSTRQRATGARRSASSKVAPAAHSGGTGGNHSSSTSHSSHTAAATHSSAGTTSGGSNSPS
jgi:hypothetical protein